MLPLTASLVLYGTPVEELRALLETLARSELSQWVAVDNAAAEQPEAAIALRMEVEKQGGVYAAAPRNLGFGAGHNFALSILRATPSEFHLMLNPDIEFDPLTLLRLLERMREESQIAVLMPRVCGAAGEFQHVCKLLPTPVDFALRRFAPRLLQAAFNERLARYEMRGIEHVQCRHVPFLSGCFLLTRRALLEQAGGFDERYFLYLEDVDLCRRMAEHGDLVYWPQVSIIHRAARGAYRSTRLMLMFLRSAILYFNRWGWFFDAKRDTANELASASLAAASPGSESEGGSA